MSRVTSVFNSNVPSGLGRAFGLGSAAFIGLRLAIDWALDKAVDAYMAPKIAALEAEFENDPFLAPRIAALKAKEEIEDDRTT